MKLICKNCTCNKVFESDNPKRMYCNKSCSSSARMRSLWTTPKFRSFKTEKARIQLTNYSKEETFGWSKLWKSSEFRSKVIESTREQNSNKESKVGFGSNRAYLNTISSVLKDRWKDPKYRDLKSKQVSNQLKYQWSNKESRNKLGSIKGYIDTKFGSIPFRSSYEVKAIKIFNEHKEIKELTYEPFGITYSLGTYYPDFLIVDTDENKFIVEVKASNMLTNDINTEKFKSAITYCKDNNIKFIVLTERELFNEVISDFRCSYASLDFLFQNI